jgi:hypothetical protein
MVQLNCRPERTQTDSIMSSGRALDEAFLKIDDFSNANGVNPSLSLVVP